MATTTTPPAIDTSALNPTFQALYDQQLPALQLAATQASQARGMFYSGDALNSQTLAQENLLASLLAQQQAQTQQTAINTQNINQQNNAQSNATAAAVRAQNIGLIGSGIGTAATLYGLLKQKPVTNMFQSGGNEYSYDPATGKATQISLPGQTSPTTAAAAAPVPTDINAPGAMSTPPGVPANSGIGSLAGTGPTPSMTDPSGALSGLADGGVPTWGIGAGADLSAGMSSAPSAGLDGLTNLATGDLGSLGGDAAGAMSSAADSGLAGLASFAKGGIISKPTIAQIGDAGPGNPEEVIPLNKLQGAIGPQGAARVMAAVPQPGSAGFGQPAAQPGMSPGVAAPPAPGMPPAPMPSMWSQPSPGGPVPPQPVSPLAALQRGGLLGNLFKPS